MMSVLNQPVVRLALSRRRILERISVSPKMIVVV